MANIQDIMKMLSPAYAVGSQPGVQQGLSSFMFGQPAQEKQFQKYTPGQESMLDNLMKQGSENVDFSGIEGLAKKRFEEDTIPSIAERFTAMGGGQRSSAFESSLGRSGSDLQAQLAAMRPQMGMQQLGMGLQPRFDSGYQPASQGFLGGGIGALLQLLPMLLGI